MDDVWGNAWSQTEDDVTHNVPTRSTLNELPSWSIPSTQSKHDEADVGTPSWSTGELNWTEPTGQVSLWSSAVADENVHLDAWATPVRTNVIEKEAADPSPLASAVSEDKLAVASDDEEDIITRSSSPQSAATAHPDYPPVEDFEVSDIQPEVTHVSRPTSPDAFGSFSIGLPSAPSADVVGGDAWSSPEFNDSGDSWGSAWVSTENANASTELVKDEWELAQEEKARRDRTVVCSNVNLRDSS